MPKPHLGIARTSVQYVETRVTEPGPSALKDALDKLDLVVAIRHIIDYLEERDGSTITED